MDDIVEKQREHFNSISGEYFNARQHPNHILLKHLIWNHFIQRNSWLSENVTRVLEPMCGMAEGYLIINDNLKIDFSYVGFDYSENMVAFAKQMHPTLEIKWGDATSFEYEGAPFDLIILIGGLHHVFRQTKEVIEKLSSCLRPGGYFLSLEPTHNNFLSRIVRGRIYKKNRIFNEESEQGYEYEELQKCFKDAGYAKVDEVYPGLLSYVLYYNPDAFPLLNRGGSSFVRTVFAFDRLFWANAIGKKLSFATLTLWKLTNLE